MPHPALLQRLAGYRKHLIAVHQSGAGMSSASKGHERRAFVTDFLELTFPVPFRFGTGDCIDTAGNQSGELDIVVEYPFLPSVTLQGYSRLYLAEGVAAVIEVKSDIAGQWGEAVATGNKLTPLTRNFGAYMTMGYLPKQIPYFAVGYTGWKALQTVIDNCDKSPVDGVLVVDSGFFYMKGLGIQATGDLSLWGLISALSIVSTGIKATSANPIDYAK